MLLFDAALHNGADFAGVSSLFNDCLVLIFPDAKAVFPNMIPSSLCTCKRSPAPPLGRSNRGPYGVSPLLCLSENIGADQGIDIGREVGASRSIHCFSFPVFRSVQANARQSLLERFFLNVISDNAMGLTWENYPACMLLIVVVLCEI